LSILSVVVLIAAGLSAFEPERVSLAAGKVMLSRLHKLADAKVSFSFETTLASRTFVPWIEGLLESGYRFHLLFLWLPSADFAVDRVAGRVRMGDGRSKTTCPTRLQR